MRIFARKPVAATADDCRRESGRISVALLGVIASVFACAVHAQFCANTAPLGQISLSSPSIADLTETPDGSRVYVTHASTARFMHLNITSGTESTVSLSDGTRGVGYTTSYGSYIDADFFTAQANGHVEAIDTATNTVFWTRDTGRSGCVNDGTAEDPPIHHLRSAATPAFQAAFANDLVYVGSNYVYDGSGGCTGDYRTDNRVYALDATDGSIAWTFNGTGVDDVDAIAGMVLDTSIDRLYVTSERTFSSTQSSVWSIDVLTGNVDWSVNAGRIQLPPVLFNGRLYIASVAGQIRALDPSNGSELWRFTGSLPFVAPAGLEVIEQNNGDILIAVIDIHGQVRVIHDDDTTSTSVSWFSLPNGDPGTTSAPTVKATSQIVSDATGNALVGADDGRLYPVDLVIGTVGTPVTVDAASSINELLLEPAGLFDDPGSVLVTTDDGLLTRYCTTLLGTQAVAMAPLASFDLGAAGFSILTEAPDATRITAIDGAMAHFVNPDLTGVAQSPALADVAVGADYAISTGSYANAGQYIGEDPDHVEMIDATGGVVWQQNIARSGCDNDSTATHPPVQHWRASATSAFQTTYASDLLYVGTYYQSGSSSVTCPGYSPEENRVYALDAADGSIVWTFNEDGSENLNRVTGLQLDAATDRLFVTTDNTHSSLQDSVWALDVLTGTKIWSTTASPTQGRILIPSFLFQDRVYVANLMGDIRAFDPDDGSEHWSFAGGVPVDAPSELRVFALANGDVIIALVDSFGQVRVLRDDDTTATPVAWFQLPNGTAGSSTTPPAIKATGRIASNDIGEALVGAENGKVYIIDLINGTVGIPVTVDVSTATVNHLLLEPPGVFADPASFLVATDTGILVRYQTDLVFGQGDSDDDGLYDSWEYDNFGDLSEDGLGNPDTDGLSNAEEQALGTSPVLADTDGDGLSDGDEVNVYGLDPIISQKGDIGPRFNPDGYWNTSDLVVMVRLVLGEATAPPESILADINADGSIDAGDLLLLTDAVLKGVAP